MSPIAIAAKQYLLYNVSSRTAICYLFKTQGSKFFLNIKNCCNPYKMSRMMWLEEIPGGGWSDAKIFNLGEFYATSFNLQYNSSP